MRRIEPNVCASEDLPVPYVARFQDGDEDENSADWLCGCDCVGKCGTSCPCLARGSDSGMRYECSDECACNLDDHECKQVHAGPRVALSIERFGPPRGLGVRVLEAVLEPGVFICEYVGERHDQTTANAYTLNLVEHFGDRLQSHRVDGLNCRNVGPYINHACGEGGNCCVEAVRVRNAAVPHLCIFSRRAIKALEELTFSYRGEDYARTNPDAIRMASDTPCACGSDDCVGYLPC